MIKMKENTISHQEWIIRFDGSIKHKKTSLKKSEKLDEKKIS